jgi:manganese/iron transport system substrate-binding protein
MCRQNQGNEMPRTKSRIGRLSLGLLALALLGACAGPGQLGSNETGPSDLKAVPLAAGEKLRVVASTNIVGDIVAHVGGDRIALTTLMGIGVDPHSYVPAPADSAAVHDAHLVLSNGLNLEPFLPKMLAGAGGQAIDIRLASRLNLDQDPQSDETPGALETGPHVWFDVNNVIQWVGIIQDTLSTLDPMNAEVYASNAAAYTRELEELDAWIVAEVAPIPAERRKLVTNHLAFDYFARRYGFQQVGAIYPISPSSEPSARDIAALEDAIRSYGVPAVFTETTVNDRLADQVAQDTGIQLVQLYTGSLGGPGSGAESYVDMMRYDVTAIAEALK